MLTRQSSPRVLLSDVEYLALKIAFSPGRSAKWYIDHLAKYVGDAPNSGPAYEFIGGQLVKFTPSGLFALGGRLAVEVPTSVLKREHLKGVPSSDNIRGYVITNAGLETARQAAVKIGIDPDTIPA